MVSWAQRVHMSDSTSIGSADLAQQLVSVLDSGAVGPGLKSQQRRCRVTVLGKLFTPIVPLFTKQLRYPALGNRVWATFTFFVGWDQQTHKRAQTTLHEQQWAAS